MAGQIQVNTTLQLTNGNHVTPTIGSSQTITQTNQGGGGPGYLDLAADTPTTIDVAEIGTEGLCYVKNLSSERNISLGREDAATYREFNLLKPGEESVLRLYPGLVYQAEAVGGTAKLLIQIYED
jgi:hypothetical protein